MKVTSFFVIWPRTTQRLLAKGPFQMGAALAYYAVFSLSPLALIAVSIAGWVYGEQAARGQLGTEIQNAVGPTAADAIETILRTANESTSKTTASIIGLVVLFFGASGLFGQLQASLNAIWEVPAHRTGGVLGLIRSRALSFALVLGIGFLLLISLGVSTALSVMSNHLVPRESAVYQLMNQVISIGLITVLFAVVFKYLPDCHVDWNDVWVGAAVTALLFSLGKYLIALYLARGTVASPYGAAGSLVIVLVWVYYASQIVLFGAQFTQVFAELRSTGARPDGSAGDVNSLRGHP